MLKHVIFLLMLFSCLSGSTQELITNAVIEDYTQDQYIFSDVLEEQRYVVNVYADWCGWCKTEWESWSECIDEYKAKYEVEFLVLGTDRKIEEVESKDIILHVLDSIVGLDKLIVYFTNQDSLIAKHGINGLPTTFMIDESGNIQKEVGGFHDCIELENNLDDVFNSGQTLDEYYSKIYYKNNQIIVEAYFEDVYDLNVYSIDGKSIAVAKNQIGNATINIAETASQIIIVTLSIDNKVIRSQKIRIVD